MRVYRRLLLISIFINAINASSQVFTIDKMGIENGLSDNYILSIAQDKDGFMWFGTEWGLNRFDGQTSKVYKVNSSSNNTVSHNGINKILVDSKDNLLWIATKEGGLNVFNCQTREFIHYPVNSSAPNSTQSRGIVDLCYDKDGNIWIATYNNGLKKLDKKTGRISHLDLRNLHLPKKFWIKSILDDHKGTLYIGHWGNGFSVLSANDLTGKRFIHDPNNPESIPGNEVMDICIDSKNNVWLGTHYGLALYRPENDKFVNFRYDKNNPDGLTSDDIHSIEEIGNQLWIGTWKGGINILDLAKEDLTDPKKVHFGHIVANDLSTGLSSPSVETIYKDHFGNIWIGTYGEGLNIISHVKPFFNKLSYSPLKGEKNGLSDKIVNSITFDTDSLLWVSLGNGYVDVYKREFQEGYFLKLKSIFLDNYILCSLVDSHGNLWFGRNMDGLIQYNKNNGSFKKVDVIKNKNGTEYIASLFEDKHHNIWIGSNNGLIIYNLDTKITKAFDGKDFGLPDNLIRNILQDVNGNFWIGSEINGVSVVTQKLGLIHNFNERNALGTNTVNYIFQDSKKQIWIATKNGLTVFPKIKDKNYESFKIDESKGLADNYIRSVAEDNNGAIWIATNAGISKYIEPEARIENYSYNDGLPYGTLKNGAVTKSPDGTIFFGTQDGICYFNSNKNTGKQALPPTVITSLNVFDSKEEFPYKHISLPVKKEINLKYSQNTVSIDFNVMDYALRDKVEYAYLLKGIDDTWYQTNMQKNVIFRNLSPGNYTLYVRAKMRNKDWSNQADSIFIRINPPFWFSWWAKFIYVSIIIFIIIAIISFYKRKIKLENQLYLEKQNHLREQEINNERLQFFTNITHELRTPLTLILGPLEDLLHREKQNTKENKKLSLIHKNAARLFNLINQLLEFRKSEENNRKLSVSKDDITILLKEIVFKYKELNKNKDVSIDLFIETKALLFFDKEVITIIMDNLISNALKNTVKGAVNIVVREIIANTHRLIEIEVNDTGIGIPSDALDKIFDRYYQVKRESQIHGTGIGLALVKNLVQLHEGTIDVKSALNQGTSFLLRFKFEETYPEAQHIETPKPAIEIKKDFATQLLIVEDNEDIREYISDIFKDSFEILTSKDGQDAILLATEKIPDIIISDIMMPIVDGIELCRKLKEDIRTCHIPIILLTAKDSEVDKTEGYSIGADSYLTKPFSANLLKTRVQNLLQGREKIASYFTSEVYKKELASSALSKLDSNFIKKTISIIEDNLGLEQINVSFLAEQQNMSYTSFSRKIKAITGMTVTEFVRDIKLQNAEQLLLSRKYSISEIALQTGFSSMAYFRESFKDKYGMLPSQYIQKLGEDNTSR
jgi:signal transduction histidine kinase/ligand-binding sensor domain-containing protein/DNA-binding response OmpR family regulator